MANNCAFSTTITAEPEKITELAKRFGQDGRLGLETYNNLFDEPASQDFEWGSKWMEYTVSYEEGDDFMEVSGDTAWGPVTGLWQRISEKYEASVETKYDEPGRDFGGRDEWNNGENTFHRETKYMQHIYETDYDYFWDEIDDRCYYYELDEIIEELGDLYEIMSEDEKHRLNEKHQENFSE